MALTRQPKIGEKVCSSTVPAVTVTRFSGYNGNICHFKYNNGKESCFIWRFQGVHPGLNTDFTILENT